VLQARLPISRAATSAVWDGQNAYIFGGWTGNSTNRDQLDDIVKFNPMTNEVTTMTAKFSTGRAYTSAAWDGQYAYVFGGQSSLPNGTGIDLDEIVRYDPSTDILQTLPVRLPFGSEGASAVWAGSAAYMFGGVDVFHGTNPANGIVKMTIKTGSNQSTQLPGPEWIFGFIGASVCVVLLCVYIVMKRRKRALRTERGVLRETCHIPLFMFLRNL
jgi:N-acetylneuraminic acid mutarotase